MFGLLVLLSFCFLRLSYSLNIVIVSGCSTHFDSHKSTIYALSNLKHNVICITCPKFKETVIELGGTYFESGEWNYNVETSKGIGVSLWQEILTVRDFVMAENKQFYESFQSYLSQEGKPDIVLGDTFSFVVASVCEHQRIPFVYLSYSSRVPMGSKLKHKTIPLSTTFGGTPIEPYVWLISLYAFETFLPLFRDVRTLDNEIRKNLGLDTFHLGSSQSKALFPAFVLLPESFMPWLEEDVGIHSVSHLPLKISNIGESIDEFEELNDFLDKWHHKKPILYSAFGKSTALSETDQNKLLQAFSKQKNFAVISVFAKYNSKVNYHVKDHIYLASHAPQKYLFQNKFVDAFITHCGLNSFFESLPYGIAYVAMPQGRDQYGLAEVLINRNAAIYLKNEFSETEIVQQLNILSERLNDLKQKSLDINAELSANNGTKKLNELVIHYASMKNTTRLYPDSFFMPWYIAATFYSSIAFFCLLLSVIFYYSIQCCRKMFIKQKTD